MEACGRPPLIGDDSLESWQRIGSGGFGEIYRAKHKKWGMDVAVKLLRYNDGPCACLLREAEMMCHGGNPNVLRILGVFEGCPPGEKNTTKLGLLMEYMERGSLADFHIALGGPPPWSLAFRIIHQIALGMNFLHQLVPPLLHLDLKPSNVLLDDSLNAKLTDFGLSKVAQSASKMMREKNDEMCGTTSYMPPEAFQLSSYTPSFSSDIYSFGILLWSVITGKEPYSSVPSTLVRFRIPEGDRPDLSIVDSNQVAELSELTKLMERCWNAIPSERPSSMDCVKVTKEVYELHKQGVYDAVHAILKKLNSSGEISSSFESLHITPPQAGNGRLTDNSHHPLKTQSTPVQDTGGIAISKPKQGVSSGHPGFSGTDHKPAFKTQTTTHRPVAQRQYSTPGPQSIILSNVTGVQIGHNNYMNINMGPKKQRQRHPTAPSHVNYTNSSQSSKHHQNPHH